MRISLTATCRGRVMMYAIASAMSSAAMVCPNWLRMLSSTSGRLWLASSVAVAPGSTSETRTYRLATSWRSDSLNAPTPCLVSEYTPLPLRAARPATELMFTMSATWRGPVSAARSRCGSAAWAQYSRPSALSSTICCHSARGAPATGPSSMTPALLISVSRRPSSAAVRSTAPAACCWSVMSHSSTTAVPPCPVMLAASSSSLSRLRAASATAAPWAASAAAVAAPIPRDAPVTSATVPFSTGSTTTHHPLISSRPIPATQYHHAPLTPLNGHEDVPSGLLWRAWPTGTMWERGRENITRRDSASGVSMIKWKARITGGAVVAAVSLAVFSLSPAHGAVSGARQLKNPATGVGSCMLKNKDPKLAAGSLQLKKRMQTYRPDNYDCDGAEFAKPGVQFRRFPHFVLLLRENHTFDDYLGDCATTIQAGCNGQVESTNHISQVPDLHALAQQYALMDSYSTGTQPPSGHNHWWLFSGQSASSSQQQSYPTAGGTEFDRFLGSDTGPSGEGTNPCTAQTGTGTGSSPYTFLMNGDFYWMLSSGSGFWRNPATNKIEMLPVNRPGTSIPEELHYNDYACSGTNIPDQTIGNDFLSFVSAHGLPSYSYVELFNDHPGSFQDIPTNDAVTKQIVDSIKNNTVIVITEDDTQNGNNGPDHVSNTFRVPTVVVASSLYMKQGYITHVAYSASNTLAVMERVMENVHPGIIDPNDNLGLSTFPMTSADQAALGDPFEALWNQGAVPLTATAAGTPKTGNAPLNVSFTGSASGGTAPYSYSWNFGDGSAASKVQNPSHTYSSAGTYTATLTVTDSASPAHTATSTVTVKVSAVGGALTATASALPTSGQVPLNVAFTGSASGGTPPYSYSWNFGDGSAVSTAQNPSHTYNNAGTYTATLTVTDSSSPAKTASSSVSISATPIAGTPPGPPTGLTASPGNGQVSLRWTPPANNGG